MLVKILKKIKKKLAKRCGFSFTEMLAAVVILLIASEGMAQGIAFASRNFTIQMRNSETRILFSTLRDTINYELKHGDIRAATGGPSDYTITNFYSPTFVTEGDAFDATFIAVDEDDTLRDYGYIRLGKAADAKVGKDIIGRGSYTYGAVAKISPLVFHERTGTPSYYSYTLTVGYKDSSGSVTDLYKEEIQVIPANPEEVIKELHNP